MTSYCPANNAAMGKTQGQHIALPCGHQIAEADLLRLAASIQGKRSAGISRGPRKGTGRNPKLSPCPKCGLEFGFVAMRRHKCAT